MEDRSEDVPEHCPGPSSENAGKTSSCQGCPNQQICSTRESKIEDHAVAARIHERLSTVKRKILILSGKGGVGKSTVTALLGRLLAQDTSKTVAIMDIDICGPSTPCIMGIEGETVHQSGSGWSPVFISDNLAVMSVGLLLPTSDDAVIWRGPRKNGLIKQFFSEVDWGTLDYLLIDTPPGTSDEHLSIAQYMTPSHMDGALIISLPQEISLLDVRKEINFCKKLNIPVIGVIENMSWFVCPKCTKESIVFPSTTGGVRRLAKEMNVHFLGQIPLDHRLAQSCDQGKDFFECFPGSTTALALFQLVEAINMRLSTPGLH